MGFDPIPKNVPGRSRIKKKIARLAGPEPGTASAIVTLHDWLGRAVYIYPLIDRDDRQPFYRLDKPADADWNNYATAGVEVAYLPKVRADDPERWKAYGLEMAAKLGLRVVE